DAVALLGEVDPHQADRIVRPGPDRELAVGVHALELEFRIVMVRGVARYLAHLEPAARRGLLLAADRGGIERDQLTVLSERAQRVRALVDFDPGDAAGRIARADIGYEDRSSGLVETLAGIEQLQQLRIDVEFLRQQLERTRIGETIEPRHLLEIPRDRLLKRPFYVPVGDPVFDDRRRGGPPGELGPGIRVELAGRIEAVCLLESRDRLADILAVPAVDLTRRYRGAIE